MKKSPTKKTKKKMTRKNPPEIYGAAINLTGAWGPYKMYYNENIDEYFDSSGDFSIKKLGLDNRGQIIAFGSTDRNEVKLWVSGVKAAMKLMSEWCKI